MSQLINRLLKPSVCKNVIRHNMKGRMFCSKPTHPYLLIDHLLKAGYNSNDQIYYDDEYREKLVIKNKGLAEEVRVAMTDGIPHIYGYRVNEKSEESDESGESEEYEDDDDDEYTSLVLVSNTPSDPVKLHLPPLYNSSRIQNVAMSNPLAGNKQDLVVAVKCLGSDVSVCKPFSDSEWINIDTSGSVHPFSSLMHSKKNNKFLTVCPSGLYFWSLDDVHPGSGKKYQPKFHYLCSQTDHLSKVLRTDLEDFISCTRTDHLVESPSGEHFLVKWFLVFRVDTVCGDLVYTRDIGDLCIFLGHNEACCVPASSSPGLRPNSIYYVGSNFGVHDIGTETCTTFYIKDNLPLSSTEFPYWPAPLSC
ncbi:hypothetical protein CARUB_v10006354mg [Capsella rubella]|uniref:KIB1-4 beta-propeller domain-containing protein n=1 Tax=Capsella rubella TaxID=81985 RepID=R0GM39_9BRAS|nr:hypothetical protein CARUB_v10006354mg [Capsella rubella]